jgi:hypothetical protein
VLILGAVTNIGVVQASTEMSGVIASDTTWTQAKSPYSLTGPMGVSEGVTLTIEPGVTVNLNSYFIQVNGTLTARGNSSDKIYFNDGSGGTDGNGYSIAPIMFTPLSTDWNEETGTGCIIEHAVLSSTEITMVSSPKICDSSFTDCLLRVHTSWSGSGYIYSASPIIANNTLDGEGRSNGIILYYSSTIITQNTITSYTTGININSDTSVVQGNYITGNDVGIRVNVHQGQSSPTIQNNSITGNLDGIYLTRQFSAPISPTIRFNDIYANSNYNIYLNVIPSAIDATYNWWGTTNTTEIGQTIYDSNEDFTLGTVTFEPFLTEPNTDITPEFTSWIFLSLLLTVTLLVVVCKRRYLDTKGN